MYCPLLDHIALHTVCILYSLSSGNQHQQMVWVTENELFTKDMNPQAWRSSKHLPSVLSQYIHNGADTSNIK